MSSGRLLGVILAALLFSVVFNDDSADSLPTERVLVNEGEFVHLRSQSRDNQTGGSVVGPLTSLDAILTFRNKLKDVGSYGLNTAIAVAPGGYGGLQPAGYPLFGGPTIDDSFSPPGYSGTESSSEGAAQAWVNYSPSAAPSCVDTHHKCTYLVSNGKCNGHFGFVAQLCPLSCGVCEFISHGLSHSPSTGTGYQQPSAFPETPYVASPPPIPVEPPPAPAYQPPISYGPSAPQTSYGSAPAQSSYPSPPAYGNFPLPPAPLPSAPAYVSAPSPSGPSYSQPQTFSGPIPSGLAYVPKASYGGPIPGGNAFVPLQTFGGPLGTGNAYVPVAPSGPISPGTAYVPQTSYGGPIGSGNAQVPQNSYSGPVGYGQAVVPQQSYGGSINSGVAVVPTQYYPPVPAYQPQPQPQSYGPAQPQPIPFSYGKSRDAPSAHLVSPTFFLPNNSAVINSTSTSTSNQTTTDPQTTVGTTAEVVTTQSTTSATSPTEAVTMATELRTKPTWATRPTWVTKRTEAAAVRIQPSTAIYPALQKNAERIPPATQNSPLQQSFNSWARPLPPAVSRPVSNAWGSQPPGFGSPSSLRSQSPSQQSGPRLKSQPDPIPNTPQPQPSPPPTRTSPPVLANNFGQTGVVLPQTSGSKWGQWSAWGPCLDRQRYRSRNCQYDESEIGSSGCVGNSYESTMCKTKG